jgi:hypothetical protein
MRRICLFALAMCLALGCASQSDKAQWDAAWKDLRGDNMKMRSDFSGTTAPHP